MRPIRCYCGHGIRMHKPMFGDEERFPTACTARPRSTSPYGCPCLEYEVDPDQDEEAMP